MPHRSALVIAGLIALAALSLALAGAAYPRDSWPVDFRAFYCAGAVVADHRDPYRTEPLRRCENEARGFTGGRGVPFAIPAPLPGYALAPFVLLSRLPHRLAAALFVAALLASLALAVVVLSRLCELRVETIFAAVLLEALFAVFLGQIVPLICAATVTAAFFVARGRDRAAALAASFAMLEPHLGLPVCLALFIARPRARAVLVGCGALCALLSVALLGLDANIEYVRDVLPAHALSEISNEEQYSLAYLAHLAGIGERAAGGLGTLSYFVMLAAGIAAGRIAAARTGRTALLLLVPPAFAVIGGPYMHVQQLAIAIPAALLLGGSHGREARPSAVAVMLLAVPWSATGFSILNLPLVAAVTFVLAIDLFGASPRRAGLVSVASLVFLVVLLLTLAPIPAARIGPVDPSQGNALADSGWRNYVDVAFHSSIVPYTFAKMLGWSGLILIALDAAGFNPARPAARRKHDTLATEPRLS